MSRYNEKKYYLNDAQTSWVIHIKGYDVISHDTFNDMWNKHPDNFATINMRGRLVATPRWVALYGKQQYYYKKENGVPVRDPSDFPHLATILPKVVEFQKYLGQSYQNYGNCLVNWYDGTKGHYIGHHSDSPYGIEPNSNIWTISYGSTRCFELKPKKNMTGNKLRIDVSNGDALIMGGTTQQTHTHSIIKPRVSERETKRISLTFRSSC
mgnify:CR=1 FL=1